MKNTYEHELSSLFKKLNSDEIKDTLNSFFYEKGFNLCVYDISEH
ncbi:MAG: hypothetical protein WC877_00410 [Dehalococcoidales bacterium]|jgi:hypothetical protein